MAKLSERVQEQQARRTRRPLPPSHPRPAAPEAAAGTEPDDQTARVIGLTAAGATAGAHAGGPSSALDPGPARTPVLTEAAAVQAPASPDPPAAEGTPAAAKRARPPAASQQVAMVPLEPRQVWLDSRNDLWLTECEYANVRRGGRKVISRSSVVRLALDRLRDAMTPEQITDLLAAREPVQQPGRGRPRR